MGAKSLNVNVDNTGAILITDTTPVPLEHLLSVDTYVTPVSITSTELIPVIEIKLKTGLSDKLVFLENLNILTEGSANMFWEILLNPTLTGDTGSYVDVSAVSYTEYRLDSGGTITNGTKLLSGYVASSTNNIDLSAITNLNLEVDTDVIVLAIRKLGGGSPDNCYSSIIFREKS